SSVPLAVVHRCQVNPKQCRSAQPTASTSQHPGQPQTVPLRSAHSLDLPTPGLYGEYQENQGGSGRREATRLLTERQIKKHGNHPRSHGRTRHGRRSHGQNGDHSRHQLGYYSRQRRRQSAMDTEGEEQDQTAEPDPTSSTKKKSAPTQSVETA
ncbi:hypothetical protein KUCAC02_011480, partial [Chaenocephalus aceratus]